MVEEASFYWHNHGIDDPFTVDLSSVDDLVRDSIHADTNAINNIETIRRMYPETKPSSDTPMQRFCTMSPTNDPMPLIVKLEMAKMGVSVGSLSTVDQRSSAAAAAAAASHNVEAVDIPEENEIPKANNSPGPSNIPEADEDVLADREQIRGTFWTTQDRTPHPGSRVRRDTRL